MKGSLFRLNPSSVSASVACLLIGLAAILFPQLAIDLIFTVLGILLLLAGGILILRYFLKKDSVEQNDYSMATGVILLLVGIVLLIAPAGIAAMLQYVFGILLLLGGALKVQGAFDLKRLGDPKWYICLIFPAIAIGAGFLITRNPFTSEVVFMRVIGIALLLEGIMDGAVSYLYDKYWKKHFGANG